MRRRLVCKGERTALSEATGEAIVELLRASGRLETMEAEEYIFAPLKEALGSQAKERREAWAVERTVGRMALDKRLRACAARAGLDETKVNWRTLRNTAVRLRAENGDSQRELKEYFGFADTRGASRLLHSMEKSGYEVGWKEGEGEAETGGGDRLKPRVQGRGAGLYAGAFAEAELRLLEQARPEGVGGEVAALRLVMLRALQRALENSSPAETLRLLDSFSSATLRLANILKSAGELRGSGDEVQEMLREISGEILRERGWEREAVNGEREAETGEWTG